MFEYIPIIQTEIYLA